MMIKEEFLLKEKLDMMDNGYAYSEVLDILSNMDEKYVNKIPKRLIEYFNKNSSGSYKKHIEPGIDFKKQNLSKRTLNILALINLKYWTKDEEHKKMLLKKYRENEENFKRINGIDNVKTGEKMFKGEIIEENKSLEIVSKKESIFIKIKKFFIRKK